MSYAEVKVTPAGWAQLWVHGVHIDSAWGEVGKSRMDGKAGHINDAVHDAIACTVFLPEFELAWAKYVAKGYQYGEDALEQVRLGYRIAQEELGLIEGWPVSQDLLTQLQVAAVIQKRDEGKPTMDMGTVLLKSAKPINKTPLRSANYAQMTPEQQWEEDERHGYLDL